MTEVLNTNIALEAIRTNDKYREEFTVVAPDMRADIVSYTANPNCGCRSRISKFIEENKVVDPVKAFFETWKPQISNLYMTNEEFAAREVATAEARKKSEEMKEKEKAKAKAAADTQTPPQPSTQQPPSQPPQPSTQQPLRQPPQQPPQLGPDGKPVTPKMMSGHVIEIPATPGEYKILVEHAQRERWQYRGLSLKDGKAADGSAVWLVFFF